jgi:hypothetical protein
MFKHLLTTVFSVFLLTFFISCQKDIDSSSGVNGGTATFVLEGAPSGCASATVAGVYATNTTLTAANTVTISVDVQSKGTYSFRTNSANGVYFVASGSFSSTGVQTVVLTGVGKPVNTGNYTYATTNKSACNFNIAFVAGTGGGGGGGTTAVFTYAGAPGNCTGATPAGTYFNTVGLNAGNFIDLNVNVTTAGAYTITTNSANGISFSGAGVFTSTGAQTVRLNGQGTPNAVGTATFTPTGGCSFNVTIAAAPAAGVFTYNCVIPPQVLGTYTAGTALNNTNTIVIAVNVTTAGSYSVTTGAANGVTFSGSGIFASTGANLITLTSTNTPTAAGPFNYTPSGAGGCGFSVTYTGGGGGGGGDFIKFSVNGGPVLTFATDIIKSYDNSSAPYDVSFSADITSGGDNFEITVTDENNPVVIGVDYFNDNLLSPTTKYCEIVYSTGGGFPFGSSLSVSNDFKVKFTTLNATSAIGTFSGKVYENFGAGPSSKTISNGSFSITF